MGLSATQIKAEFFYLADQEDIDSLEQSGLELGPW